MTMQTPPPAIPTQPLPVAAPPLPQPVSLQQSLNQVELAKLKAAGFELAGTNIPRRAIVSISGKPKEGKTHFSFTAPPPIFLLDIDTGTEGVVEKFRKGEVDGHPKEIYVKTIRVPDKESQNKYSDLWEEVKRYLTMVWGFNRGSLITDTSSELYELSRLAKFGKLTQVQPYHYVEVNMEWKEIMKKAYDADQMNSIFIHRLKNEYVNNAKTGKMEVAGYGDMEYQTQINVLAYRDYNVAGVDGFRLFVKDCRRNANINGMLIDQPHLLNMEFLLTLIHGQ